MSNRVIFNNVAESLKMQAYGDEAQIPINLDSNGNLNVTGSVNVSSTNPIEVTGTLDLEDGTMVALTGTPNFIIGGHSTTQIDRSFSLTVVSSTTLYTDAIDISTLGKYSYYVLPSTQSVTIQPQVAPVSLTASFIDTSTTSVVVDTTGAIIDESDFLKNSRLKCVFATPAASYSVTVTVIFQGQY